ncbi:MAG TPA: TerC family protein [Lacipirellulaceae bacterium]|nr:TerC family protein [Lacipirellulaceae bacterium]
MLLIAEVANGAVAAAGTAHLPVTWVHWVAFCAGTFLLLALDMLVFHRDSHEPTLRESALWTLFWCALALAFNGWLWWWAEQVAPPGSHHALAFLTGYLVEWSLSMDNVFVFVVIFAFFGVPLKYQYRVLFWGIIGAIALRLLFIVAAAGILHYFEGAFYIFGAFLVYTAIKLATSHGMESHPDQNIFVRLGRKYLRVAEGSHGEKFFVRRDGRLFVTSLFLVLLVIDFTDVLFAIDSVPAIFGITDDPFIVFTSNIFAVMGLRALYFLLAGVMTLFRYLNYGLSAVLGFIGVKMLLHRWWEMPHWQSLLVIIGLLGASIVASLVAAQREKTTGGRR